MLKPAKSLHLKIKLDKFAMLTVELNAVSEKSF
jgi:hypothetical protein